jgi:hypothetical protein
MWVTGKLAYEVLVAARAWREARLAACKAPLGDKEVWLTLSNAEDALRQAIEAHTEADA